MSRRGRCTAVAGQSGSHTQGDGASVRVQAGEGGALKAPPRAPQAPKKPAPAPQQAQPSGNGHSAPGSSSSSSSSSSRSSQPARSSNDSQKRKGQDSRGRDNKPRFTNNKHANGKAFNKGRDAQREKRGNRDGAGQSSLMTLDDDDEDILVNEAEADQPIAEAAESEQAPQ